MRDELHAGQTGRKFTYRGRAPDLGGGDGRGEGGSGDDTLAQELPLGVNDFPGMEGQTSVRRADFGGAPAVNVESTSDCVPGVAKGRTQRAPPRHHPAVMPGDRIGEGIGEGSGLPGSRAVGTQH